MTDTHATYEAMHREIKAGTNRDLAHPPDCARIFARSRNF